MKEFIKQSLSDENGQPSSKRGLGSIVIIAYIIIVAIMAMRYGATEIVKDLLETAFIGGCSLVGISSVTKIFNNNNNEEQQNND